MADHLTARKAAALVRRVITLLRDLVYSTPVQRLEREHCRHGLGLSTPRRRMACRTVGQVIKGRRENVHAMLRGAP